MTYRQLTAEEIIRLGQEMENRQRWERVREFVALLYGPRAHQVTISVTSEYNDSGYDEQVSILVTDQEGEPVRYDFSMPWWSGFVLSKDTIAEYQQDASGRLDALWDSDGRERAHGALKALVTEKLGIDFLEHWQPFDPITYTYVVDTPPAVSFSAVYAED
jgi:hypothetical protein